MKMVKELQMGASIIAVTLSVSGCGKEPEASDPVQNETVGSASAQLLATVAVEPEHSIKFFRSDAGFVFISETGSRAWGTPLSSAPAMQGKGPADIYRSLAPNAEVPQALLDAEAQAATLKTELDYPPSDVAAHGAGPNFYDSGQQTWFAQAICPGAVKCIQGFDWIDSGWDYTTSWKSTTLIGSEGTVNVTVNAEYWKCSGGSCNWSTFLTITLAPGHYNWISGSGLFYYKGAFGGAGGGTQVSMAINDAPYQCAHCNDGSCQCGHMDAGNLCSAHSGNDPSIGCVQQP